MSNPMACECASLPDLTLIDMANPGRSMDTLVEVASRGQPYWWLEASRCTECGSAWLIGHEERQNDIFALRRLRASELADILEKRIWPSDFDEYETLLKLGRDAGHSVWWLDPIGGSSLLDTITDLARQRPGIRVSELAELLNI